jgi:hypothetical protein
MIILKKSLPRRAVLRGIGATVALPLLDAMVPAFTAEARTAANPGRRFGAVYIPHGAMMDRFTPKGTGAGFELSPILSPFEPLRDRLCVISGLDGPPEPAGGGGHAIGPASWLSGVNPRVTQGADILGGTTIDQVIAAHISEDTALSSLQVGTEDSSRFVGACEIFYSCSYVNTVSWRTPTMPLPVEINPRVVFERMFGGSGTAAERLVRIQEDRSILDSIADATRRLLGGPLGSGDRRRLGDYLENVREIERRIQRAEQNIDSRLAIPNAPEGVPDEFEERVTLMLEMLALALQADVTRVFTFMMFRDYSQQTYPHLGVPDPNHALSHHQNNPERMAKLARVNQYHYGLFARFVDKLRSIPDGDGSLLDHTVLLCGSGMDNPNRHTHARLPLLVAGGGIPGNRHLPHPDGTPVGNLLVSLAQKFEVDVDRFGETTGRVDL